LEEKQKLLQLLRKESPEAPSPNTRRLFAQISAVQYQINKNLLSGILRVVYTEAAKYFRLLEAMDFDVEIPNTIMNGLRAALLATLKQENLRKEDIPIAFADSTAFLDIYQGYKELTREEQREFDKDFLLNERSTNLVENTRDLIVNSSFSGGPIHLLFRCRREL